MKISDDYLPYDAKTYILVCDRSLAKVCQAHKKEFTCIDTIENDRLKLDDVERYSTKIGKHRLAKSRDELLKEREADTFYKYLARMLFERKQMHQFERLILIVPHDDKNMLLESLHPELKQMIDLVLAKQLTKLAENQLIKVIDHARRKVK